MDRKSQFFRALPSVTTFDGENLSRNSSSSNSSGDHAQSNNSIAVLPTHQQSSVHLFHIALLEHVCRMYETDRAKSRKVYLELCNELSRMGIMNPLSRVDELEPLISQLQATFSNLMQRCINKVDGIHPPKTMEQRLQVLMQPRVPAITLSDGARSDFIHPSRYMSEFTELGRVGEGAFGHVYKVKHKLDGKEYAVKKVACEGDTHEMLDKMLREARMLAELSHWNIVRYFTAWLEPHIVRSLSPPMLKAITNSSHKSGVRCVGAGDEGESSGVVFEENSVNLEGNEPSMSNLLSSSLAEETDDFLGSVHTLNRSQPCMVLHLQMELCVQTLSEWLEKRNKRSMNHANYSVVDEKDNERILKQLLHALAFIHSKDLIHRDVKPKNIFLTYDTDEKLHVKLGDFGLTRTTKSQPNSPLTPHPGFFWSTTTPTPKVKVIDSSSSQTSDSAIMQRRDKKRHKNGLRNCQRSVQFESESSKWTETVERSADGGACNIYFESSSHTEKSSSSVRVLEVSEIDTSSEGASSSDNLVKVENRDTSRSENTVKQGQQCDNHRLSQALEGSGSIERSSDTPEVRLSELSVDPQITQGSSVDPVSAQFESPTDPLPHFIGEPENSEFFTTGVGTTIYAAPEQLDSSNYDNKVDMFSVGLVLYELYQPFSTEMERIVTLRKLRKGEMDRAFQQKWPLMTNIIRDLLSSDASVRPSATSLLEGEIFQTQQQIIHRLTTDNDSLRNENEKLKQQLREREQEIFELRQSRRYFGAEPNLV